MYTVKIKFISASIEAITFSPLIEDRFLDNLDKSFLYITLNNKAYYDYILIENITSTCYTIKPASKLDFYDVMLIYIKSLDYESPFYTVYFHNTFYKGDSLHVLPALPINMSKNTTVTSSLIKTNNIDLNNITGSTLYITKPSYNCQLIIPDDTQKNTSFPVRIMLFNKDNTPVPDSKYIICISTERISDLT